MVANFCLNGLTNSNRFYYNYSLIVIFIFIYIFYLIMLGVTRNNRRAYKWGDPHFALVTPYLALVRLTVSFAYLSTTAIRYFLEKNSNFIGSKLARLKTNFSFSNSTYIHIIIIFTPHQTKQIVLLNIGTKQIRLFYCLKIQALLELILTSTTL